MFPKALPQFALVALVSALISLPALADSHVRIVRLSYIEGDVQIDRDAGQFERAIVNLPITEGTKLRTGAQGRAEVEFENGSTLRLAPSTTIEFPQLSLRDSGAKLSTVDLAGGTAYVDFAGTRKDELNLQFGREKILLTHAAHLRISDGEKGEQIAVFKGEVQVDGASGTTEVKKNQSANFDAAAEGQAALAKNIEPQPLDSWDKQQSQYHQRYANDYNNYSPYAYGTSDLSYYGTFFSAPGYGMLWQPYFIGAGWDPFMDGAWAFSPGFGYGWVSAYPWGWTPYHYGSWVFLPGYGWAWEPGGVWTPWYSQPRLLNAPTGFKPPQAPSTIATKGTTIVPVNRGPVSNLAAGSGSKVLIRNNSAGLGVPRGQVANLAKASHEVQQRGTTTERVHASPVARPAPSLGRSETRSERSPEPRMISPAPAPAPAPRVSSPGPHK